MGGLRHLRAEAALLSSQRWSGERSNFLLSTGCRELFSCRVQYHVDSTRPTNAQDAPDRVVSLVTYERS